MSTERVHDPDTDPAQYGDLEHVTVVEEDGTRCTVFPQDCEEEELVTHWLTAEAASFVSLARMQ